ncbi:hypothetical protein PGT21_012801 [Puccinia graminis f. sp. tritici]|uniref:Uncharacterized protein n=1 Tax=Puccinia graminis f. sp. tritici TaxID=56615 RepID=A0A5B0PEN7_PUCGR|nr:hypothetical protein PGT21_012801 [Puccinia graminis f. sp. tritici]
MQHLTKSHDFKHQIPSSSYHRHNNQSFPTSPNQPSPICSASTSINTQLTPTFLSFNSPSVSDSFSPNTVDKLSKSTEA